MSDADKQGLRLLSLGKLRAFDSWCLMVHDLQMAVAYVAYQRY